MEVAKTDADIAPILRDMFANHDAAELHGDLETVPRLAPPPPSSHFHLGDVVGAYRLILPLGHGGMGEVWLADQIDGRVIRQVALKLPTQVQHLEVWRRRFQRERDILAKLTHPNIARLFDAGVDEKLSHIGIGQPYLALEYIEGRPLGEYVDAQSLTINQRLKLYRQVLAATAHAHQHLVVHRDLKPSNILVTANGEVKLLDFGIAKLIDEAVTSTAESSEAREKIAATELTQAGGRVMTMRYAAPEQVTGDTITTATDVYALGVILHELMTGQSPYRATREARRLSEAALTDEPTQVPSSLALTDEAAIKRGLRGAKQLTKAINGDLDSVILKAMRKVPEERYLSVTAMDDDVRRHLDGNPVLARKGTWRYLASRFVARHKIPMIAGALALLAIIAGGAFAEYERRVAVAERERAEFHFKSVRTLANSLMFDVHDQIKNLPGATKARQVLVENASKYLEQLSSESKLDNGLRLELAKAYQRLAGIQGGDSSQNIGKPSEALKSYEHAIGLLTPIASSTGGNDKFNANSTDIARQLALCYSNIGQLQVRLGKLDDAYASLKSSVDYASRVTATPNATLEDKVELVKLTYAREQRLAALKKDSAIALRSIATAVAAVEALRVRDPNDENLLSNLAWLYTENGHILRDSGNPNSKPEAIKKYEAALVIREAFTLKSPDNSLYQRNVLANHNALGKTYAMLGDFKSALKHLGAANDAMLALADRDPDNLQYQSDVLQTLLSLAECQLSAGDFVASRLSTEAALRRVAALPPDARRIRRTWAAEASMHRVLGGIAWSHARTIPNQVAARREDLLTARSEFGIAMKMLQDEKDQPNFSKAREANISQFQKSIGEIDAQLASLKAKRS